MVTGKKVLKYVLYVFENLPRKYYSELLFIISQNCFRIKDIDYWHNVCRFCIHFKLLIELKYF